MFSSPPIEAEGDQVTRSCTPSPFYRVFREFQTKVRVHVRLRVRLRTVVCSLTIMYLRPTPTLRARTANHTPALNHVTALSLLSGRLRKRNRVIRHCCVIGGPLGLVEFGSIENRPRTEYSPLPQPFLYLFPMSFLSVPYTPQFTDIIRG